MVNGLCLLKRLDVPIRDLTRLGKPEGEESDEVVEKIVVNHDVIQPGADTFLARLRDGLNVANAKTDPGEMRLDAGRLRRVDRAAGIGEGLDVVIGDLGGLGKTEREDADEIEEPVVPHFDIVNHSSVGLVRLRYRFDGLAAVADSERMKLVGGISIRYTYLTRRATLEKHREKHSQRPEAWHPSNVVHLVR